MGQGHADKCGEMCAHLLGPWLPDMEPCADRADRGNVRSIEFTREHPCSLLM